MSAPPPPPSGSAWTWAWAWAWAWAVRLSGFYNQFISVVLLIVVVGIELEKISHGDFIEYYRTVSLPVAPVRFLVGLGTGVNTVLVPIYISESLPCTCEKCHHCSIPLEEELKGKDCLEWWIKLLSAHGIDNYARVMYVMREIVEAIVTLLLSDERGSIIPLSFLLGMLKIRITIDMEISYMHELERRIGYSRFLERVDEEDEDNGYDIDSTGHHHGSFLKVGRIMNAYLAEIARDPYLSLQKFTAII
uniref:NPH3 domain-containing protein n=1 Tax=Brassica oleracea var. oleracea TaxID=109376 RepID=A0A0D3C7T1_BRAOL